MIKAFDGKTLSYKDVKIACRIKDTAEFNKKLTNLAEITEDKDSDGDDIDDRDSTPDDVDVPSDEDLPTTKMMNQTRTMYPDKKTMMTSKK